MTFFEQERMKDNLTKMLRLNDSKQLETHKLRSHLLEFILLNLKMYHIDQECNVSELEQIPPGAKFRKFAYVRMKLTW